MIYVMNYNDEVIIVRWGGVGWGGVGWGGDDDGVMVAE